MRENDRRIFERLRQEVNSSAAIVEASETLGLPRNVVKFLFVACLMKIKSSIEGTIREIEGEE